MSPTNRPPAAGKLTGSLVFLVIVLLLVGGIILWYYMQEARRRNDQGEQLVADLHELPPGRIDAFNQGGDRRRGFVQDNPSWKDRLEKAEDEWLGRTLDGLEGQAADPAAALAELRRLVLGCEEGSARRFREQVRQALDRAVEAAAGRSAALLDGDAVGALDLARCCLEPFGAEPPAALTEARRRALARCVRGLTGRLEMTTPDDAKAAAAWLKDRQAVERAAGSEVEPLRQAEGRWLDATVAAVLADPEAGATKEPAATFARIAEARSLYADWFAAHPGAERNLAAGEGRFLQAVVDRAVGEAERLRGPMAASVLLHKTAAVCAAPLQRHPGPADRLREARRKAVQAALDAARREARGLIERDRFQAAAAVAERLHKELRDDAEAVGGADALIRFRDECGYLADLARQAGKADPP
jgi:hypothetical protein